jgi:hypothetical protein
MSRLISVSVRKFMVCSNSSRFNRDLWISAWSQFAQCKPRQVSSTLISFAGLQSHFIAVKGFITMGNRNAKREWKCQTGMPNGGGSAKWECQMECQMEVPNSVLNGSANRGMSDGVPNGVPNGRLPRGMPNGKWQTEKCQMKERQVKCQTECQTK